MKTHWPGIEHVRAALARLTIKQLGRLAALSDVPASTIYKIRSGATANPGIETVRAFLPHIAAAKKPPRPTSG